MTTFSDDAVKEKFASYPSNVRNKLLALRRLIYTVAREESVANITETLKWGEPSYIASQGSTIRMDWKPKSPEQYALYFNCNTSLVETFKELYGNTFTYEGNRAIVFGLQDRIPLNALRHCLFLSLHYKKLKHLPLLGS